LSVNESYHNMISIVLHSLTFSDTKVNQWFHDPTKHHQCALLLNNNNTSKSTDFIHAKDVYNPFDWTSRAIPDLPMHTITCHSSSGSSVTPYWTYHCGSWGWTKRVALCSGSGCPGIVSDRHQHARATNNVELSLILTKNKEWILFLKSSKIQKVTTLPECVRNILTQVLSCCWRNYDSMVRMSHSIMRFRNFTERQPVTQ
jgi:hypothetical protein